MKCIWSRRELLVVDVERLQQTLDRRELVGESRIWKVCGSAGLAVMRAQQPVAQAVEGADPHAARVDRQHRRQPRQHFARGLVGERDREHAMRAHLAGLDQPGDAGREHARLAAAGTGEDQGMLGRQGDGGELFGIEIVEQAGHGSIVREPAGQPGSQGFVASLQQNPDQARPFTPYISDGCKTCPACQFVKLGAGLYSCAMQHKRALFHLYSGITRITIYSGIKAVAAQNRC
jgi:hypothetical protein